MYTYIYKSICIVLFFVARTRTMYIHINTCICIYTHAHTHTHTHTCIYIAPALLFKFWYHSLRKVAVLRRVIKRSQSANMLSLFASSILWPQHPSVKGSIFLPLAGQQHAQQAATSGMLPEAGICAQILEGGREGEKERECVWESGPEAGICAKKIETEKEREREGERERDRKSVV